MNLPVPKPTKPTHGQYSLFDPGDTVWLCRECGRRLTAADSLLAMIGPICRANRQRAATVAALAALDELDAALPAPRWLPAMTSTTLPIGIEVFDPDAI